MILSRVWAFFIATLYSCTIFFPSLNRNEDRILGNKSPKTCDPTPYKYGEIRGRNRILLQAGLAKLIGLAGETNIQLSSTTIIYIASTSIHLAMAFSKGVSEEDEEATFVEPSNVENATTVYRYVKSTCYAYSGEFHASRVWIFGIYLMKDGGESTIKNVLYPAKNMLAAGYCMYGSSCKLMLNTGTGVNGSRLLTLLESSY
ncbi:fructose-1,6-bisphosphatase, cytosolic-like [Primulina tabacum]|uniref:fructose-1,6-bisphosphatase, cytosolic-like n=1 Tax=Primulina tabacum TaxID=48773 RepID=UPI003F5954BB